MTNDIIYESQLGVGAPGYLGDYLRVQDRTVLPISAFLEMALAAASDRTAGQYQLAQIEFSKILFLPESAPCSLRTILSPTESGDFSFRILSRQFDNEEDDQEGWIPYAQGNIQLQRSPEPISRGRASAMATRPGKDPIPEFSLFYFGSSDSNFSAERYRLLLDGARFADRHGFSAVWTPERHFHAFGGSYPAPAILSAALATITERVRLRAGSVVLPLHHPIHVAEEWSVVDNLSNGRVGLSFATGWSADDFVVAPHQYEERREILFSSLQLLKRFWRGEEINLPNGSGKMAAVRLFPLPKQSELPTWITIVKNPEMYVKAGEIGANVLTNLLSQTTEELSRNIALYRNSLASNGYDPNTGHVTLLVHTFIGRDIEQVKEVVRLPFCNYLESTVGIIQNLVKSLDLNLDLASLTRKDTDDLLSYAFERYFQSSALLGTATTAREMIAQLTHIGVNEIGCFIDFGVDYHSTMDSLHLLNEVREIVSQNAAADHSRRSKEDGLTRARARCREKLSGTEFYRNLKESGITYGPRFQAVQNIWKGDREALGQLRLPSQLNEEADGYFIHPVLLDASIQVLAAILPTDEGGLIQSRNYLPVRLDELRIFERCGAMAWAETRIHPAVGAADSILVAEIRILSGDGRVLAELNGLHLQRFERPLPFSQPTTLENILYELQWPQKALPVTAQRLERFPQRERGKWLILADAGGLGRQVADRLIDHGEACITVIAGQGYNTSEQGYQINPQSPEDFRLLLEEPLAKVPLPWRGIIHLWNIDTVSSSAPSRMTLESAQTLGCESVLLLLQALAKCGWSESPKLWLVTRGSQKVGPDASPIAIAQAPLWGFGRAITGEHPELQCVTIDLDSRSGGAEASAIFDELWFKNDEDQISFRDGQRHVARLVRCAALDAAPSETQEPAPTAADKFQGFRRDGTYLITGGFGVLGLILSRHLVQLGVRHLALMGRSGPSAEAHDVLQGLRTLGAQVCEISGDVSEPADVRRALEQIKNTMTPLCGIIHAAMWIEDAVLLQLSRDQFAAAIKPKVYGAWNLHQHSLDLPLDFFVLFSSAVSLLGSAGQGNYVAANAFLDALAHYRRSLNLPGLTINWGQWAEQHMQSRSGLKERMALMGMRPIPLEQALEAFEWLLRHDYPEMMVMSVNWSQVSRTIPAERAPALLSQLLPRKMENFSQRDRSSNNHELNRAEFLALSPNQRQAWLQSHLLATIGAVLRIDPFTIDEKQPLNTMGLDSLMAIEIKNSLEVDLNITLPLVRLLEGPSVAQLAKIISEDLAVGYGVDSERLGEIVEHVAQLSDEEARELLSHHRLPTTSE